MRPFDSSAVAPLLSGISVFPLLAGMDYTERVFPLLAAANPAIWQAMQAGIRIKPTSQRLISRLQEQGWIVDLPLV
jgi:hypothetical protein